MNFKQKILHILYPLIKKISKSGKMGTVLHNTSGKNAPVSFYLLAAVKNNGQPFNFLDLKGKKVVIVNTASDCGYTRQYEELQQLHHKMGDRIAIIAFPANDFGAQEKGSDDDIAQFCQVNFELTFPIAQKGVVIKNNDQQPVFKWLTHAPQNGWNDHAPDWNFSKYIIDENGNLIHYFGSSISPMDTIFLEALEK
jgi:glutathione peroxidase